MKRFNRRMRRTIATLGLFSVLFLPNLVNATSPNMVIIKEGINVTSGNANGSLDVLMQERGVSGQVNYTFTGDVSFTYTTCNSSIPFTENKTLTTMNGKTRKDFVVFAPTCGGGSLVTISYYNMQLCDITNGICLDIPSIQSSH